MCTIKRFTDANASKQEYISDYTILQNIFNCFIGILVKRICHDVKKQLLSTLEYIFSNASITVINNKTIPSAVTVSVLEHASIVACRPMFKCTLH